MLTRSTTKKEKKEILAPEYLNRKKREYDNAELDEVVSIAFITTTAVLECDSI
jgi:hypothetical protein